MSFCKPELRQAYSSLIAVIPIDRMVPLEEAGAAQAAAEKGGIGKILLLT